MTEERFFQGSIVDKSVYAYSLYMLVNHGWIEGANWAMDALEAVVTWFGKIMCVFFVVFLGVPLVND